MPISLNTVQNATAHIQITFQDETAGITYRPGVMTPAFLDGFAGKDDPDADRLAETVKIITDVVQDWEITGDDGANLPVTPEVAKILPFSLLELIITSIQEDMSPGEAIAGGSFSS